MKLGDIAHALALELHGDADHPITAIAPIESAMDEHLAFVTDARYTERLEKSRAGVVIVPAPMAAIAPGNHLIADNPYAAYAEASWLLSPPTVAEPGIHASAIVDPTANVATSASIGPGVVIGAQCHIEDEVVVGAHCVIGAQVSIGTSVHLFPRVTIYDKVSIGRESRVQSGAVLGSEGFGFAPTRQGWRAIQQTGGLEIGERVHIGANTTIDCGALEPTVIANGVILDNQIQIAHNVQIGENTAIAGCVGIAGSTRIGKHCQIGGACNIVGHLEIADNVVLNAASLVSRSIPTAGRYGSGTPLMPIQAWRRSFVSMARIDDIARRLRRLERG